MTSKRTLVHATFLFLLPISVAAFDWTVMTALGLVVLLLLWRWLIVLSGFVAPVKTPEIVLETISASHFAEKVRWCMDRMGLLYTEKKVAGTLGAFYLGRTVPQLTFRTGAVSSTIGNSTEILRYLYGRYAEEAGIEADFLRPTPLRSELEQSIDRQGVKLQIWVYHHLLNDRDLTLHAWGANDPDLPAWQRTLLKVLFPLQAFMIRRSFRISDESFAKAVARIEAFLAEMDGRLADGQASLSGAPTPDYVDFAFAAINGLWQQPAMYGGGQADHVKIDEDRMPERMRMDVTAWRAAYPNAVAHIDRLYADHRRPA